VNGPALSFVDIGEAAGIAPDEPLAIGGRSFPPELVETFEPVMQEEGRHILFFINWAVWRRLGVRAFLIWESFSLARDVNGDTQDNNFTLTGANRVGVDVTLPELLDICLAANSRRLSVYDARLLRPRLVPALVRFARRFMSGTKRFAAA